MPDINKRYIETFLIILFSGKKSLEKDMIRFLQKKTKNCYLFQSKRKENSLKLMFCRNIFFTSKAKHLTILFISLKICILNPLSNDTRYFSTAYKYQNKDKSCHKFRK